MNGTRIKTFSVAICKKKNTNYIIGFEKSLYKEQQTMGKGRMWSPKLPHYII